MSARIHETGSGLVKQIDGNDEKYEDHEGDDARDKAFDSDAGIVDFTTSRFLSALLTWWSMISAAIRRDGHGQPTLEQNNH